MMILYLTVAIIAIAMVAMAIGVVVSGKRLRGSCGGVGGDCACDKAGIAKGSRSCDFAER